MRTSLIEANEMQKIQIAVVSSEAARKERSGLLDGLVVVLAWLGKNWGLVADPAQADLLVVLLDDKNDQFPLWQRCRAQFPSKRMVACGANEFPQDSLWQIRWKASEKAISVPQAFHVLSRLAESLEPPSFSGEMFTPEEYFQGIISDTLNDGVSRICSFAGREAIYLFPMGRTCYVLNSIETLIPLFLARRDEIDVRDVDEEELLKKINLAGFTSRLSKYTDLAESLVPLQGAGVRVTKSYDMDEMLWLATLVNARGRLLRDYPYQDFNRIKQWPDFIRSPFYYEYLPALESQAVQGVNMWDFAIKTQASRRQLVDLHNALAMLSLVERDHSARQNPELFKLAQAEIYRLFKPISADSAGRVKIIISGPVGSGKSTSINTLKHCSPIVSTITEQESGKAAQLNNSPDKLDHGEILFKDLVIRIYGTPDQRRYGFIGDILCRNARGLLLLVSNKIADPIGELDFYLNRFKPNFQYLRIAIGVTFYDEKSQPSLAEYRRYLNEQGMPYPVMPVSVENPMDMAKLLGCLAE